MIVSKLGKALLGESIETDEPFYIDLDEFFLTKGEMPNHYPMKEETWEEAYPVFTSEGGHAWVSLDFVLENFEHIINIKRFINRENK